MSKFAKRLKEAREDKKLSQRALSGKLGLSHGMVNHWETGTAVPSMDLIISLCKILNISADYLLGLKDFE